MSTDESLAERKRQRLEAWKLRRKQADVQNVANQETAVSIPIAKPIKLQLSLKVNRPRASKKKSIIVKSSNVFGFAGDDDEKEENVVGASRKRLPVFEASSLTGKADKGQSRTGKRGKWDDTSQTSAHGTGEGRSTSGADSLDRFMHELNADEARSMSPGTMARASNKGEGIVPLIQERSVVHQKIGTELPQTGASQVSQCPTGWVEFQYSVPLCLARLNTIPCFRHLLIFKGSLNEESSRAFIEALKQAPTRPAELGEKTVAQHTALAADVKSEKQKREQRLKHLEREAGQARLSAQADALTDFGRLFNDVEGGVMEEAERNLDTAKAAPDALQVLAELNKKKELKAVDHSSVNYIPFNKNLYIVPRALANLNSDEVANLRGKLKVRVRGLHIPAPVASFSQCGLSERILKIMEKQNITKPFPVQAQCLPCIMAGRDVIGIAKTGSGKTLAYLLPMFRHILDQPNLEPSESGPIGLVLAPARELAYQIHLVCKEFTKQLGLK